MKFDLNNQIEVLKFKTKVEYLLKNKSKVDLTKIVGKRPLNQNKYLHVLFSLFSSKSKKNGTRKQTLSGLLSL